MDSMLESWNLSVEEENTQGLAVNECYKDIANELKVTYFSHRRFSTNMTEDGLHLNPSQIGELAADFKTAFQRFDQNFVFFECNQVQLRIKILNSLKAFNQTANNKSETNTMKHRA